VLATAYGAHPERFPGGLSPAASVPHGSLDQPTQCPGALAPRIEAPASDLPTRPPSRSLPRSLRSRHAREREGEGRCVRGAKPGRAKAKARPPIARKPLKSEGSRVRAFETRLAEALDQQAATSEILRVISSSRTDVQPVFNAIVRECSAALRRAVWRRLQLRRRCPASRGAL